MISPKCNKCSVTYVHDTMNQLSWVWSLHHRVDRPFAGTSTKGSMINRLEKKGPYSEPWEIHQHQLHHQLISCFLGPCCLSKVELANLLLGASPTQQGPGPRFQHTEKPPATAGAWRLNQARLSPTSTSATWASYGSLASGNLTYLAGWRPTNFPPTWDPEM